MSQTLDRSMMAEYEETALPPEAILNTPLLNKGTGFSQEERDDLDLNGLLPPQISTIEQQLERRLLNFRQIDNDLDRHVFLSGLQNRNEVLFYRLVLENASEMLPYIYTPTVGDASLDFSNIYNKSRGLFLSHERRDQMHKIIESLPQQIDAIVVTDGSRVLGLGDLGIGGMSISVGKLALYSLFGGVHPGKTLPIVLDVGTNNEDLLNDPLYLGARHRRLEGEEYESFIEEFVTAIKAKYPNVLLQWEDFRKPYATQILDKYRDQICSFNDDIQGTAAVTLAALLAAIKASGGKLEDQRFAILGAGAAGVGIADLVVTELKRQGISEEKAKDAFYLFNRYGLIHDGMDLPDPHQKRYARTESEVATWDVVNKDAIDLLETVRHAKPTILIGVSGQPGKFTQEIIEEMHKHTPRPIVFPLSNPTSKIEATPEQILNWTKGQAIVSTGSPFKPVEFEGKQFAIAQCNNVYVFPGVGIGVIASKAKNIPDEFFIRAAEILSDEAPILKDPSQGLLPSIDNLRDITRKIAIGVAELAVAMNLSDITDVESAVDANMWMPHYSPLRRK
ncbi:MAG: NAD-dependent malic enzyme [Simkaniaceae bacterium]|nr:NAD-dependent malic enzyme [Simkaniaceae bacterium]